MIDIAKLKAYVNEKYVAQDSSEETKLLFDTNQKSIFGFARNITGLSGKSPFGGFNQPKEMSPVKRPDFQRVKDKLKASEKQDDFVRRLLYYVNYKEKTHPQVYNAAGMTPDCFSKIISGKTKSPTRINVIALAFALELNLDEAQDLLSRAGYSFPVPTIKEDIIFQYCFEDREGPHTIDEVNDALVSLGFKPIGGRT